MTRTNSIHVFGTDVSGMNIDQALEVSGLNWEVQTEKVKSVVSDDRKMGKYQGIFRQDTGKCFGFVKNYNPIQNRELLDIASELSDQGNLQIEVAGSCRGGEMVWFLLRGEDFTTLGSSDDVIAPYLLMSLGHNGKASINIRPTTIRLQCINTLPAVIRDNNQKFKGLSYRITHKGNKELRKQNFERVLVGYNESLETTKKQIDKLSVTDVSKEEIQQFFFEMYQKDFGKLDIKSKDKADVKKVEKAKKAFYKMGERFEQESESCGKSLWTCFNAYTYFLQHEGATWKNPQKEQERRSYNNLFGKGLNSSESAFLSVLSSVSA